MEFVSFWLPFESTHKRVPSTKRQPDSPLPLASQVAQARHLLHCGGRQEPRAAAAGGAFRRWHFEAEFRKRGEP